MLLDISNNFITHMRIAKFGGSSLADFNAMNRSADIILANPAVRLVVLSASANVTNILIALSENSDTKLQIYYIDKIRSIQYKIIEHLTKQTLIRKKIDQMIDNITVLAKSAGLVTSLDLIDELISYGELMSTLLFVEVLHQRGITASWFDIRKVMRTNDHFGQAKPDTHILKIKVHNLLLPSLKKELVITQGFIGSEATGRTTTLGRGGSDYTATLLGEALKVNRIDIWTDVSGIYTTDPHVVPTAKRIDKITFEKATEMSILGAQILHPATMIPAIRSAIPIFIGSSKDPNAGGTLIYNYAEKQPCFRALTLRRRQILLKLYSFNVLHNINNFLIKVSNVLTRHDIAIDFITTSEVSITLIVNTVDLTNNSANNLIQTLLFELSNLCQVEVKRDLTLITLINNKLSQAYIVWNKIFNILDPLNSKFIYYSMSNHHNLYLLVPDKEAERILRILHSAIFD